MPLRVIVVSATLLAMGSISIELAIDASYHLVAYAAYGIARIVAAYLFWKAGHAWALRTIARGHSTFDAILSEAEKTRGRRDSQQPI